MSLFAILVCSRWLYVTLILAVYVIIMEVLITRHHLGNHVSILYENSHSQIHATADELAFDQVRQTNHNVQKILVLSYMRCGSSLTGDLFQTNPDVFYFFEPLWYTGHFYERDEPLVFLNGTVIYPRKNVVIDMRRTDSYSLEVLRNIFTCNFYNLDVGTLTQPMIHLMTTATARRYGWCSSIPENQVKDFVGLRKCIGDLASDCLKAKSIAIKTIRTSMDQLEVLLQEDPTIKTIHLIRDPRGSIHSQYRMGEFRWARLKEVAADLCSRMNSDLTTSQRLSRKFPNRILTVRYEDIAEHPIEALKHIYKFVGLNMTDEIKQYVWNITSSGMDETCSFCTYRSNSTRTAYAWKFYTEFKDNQLIQDQCTDVFEKMGYQAILQLSESKNKTFSTKRDDFHSDIPIWRPSLLGRGAGDNNS